MYNLNFKNLFEDGIVHKYLPSLLLDKTTNKNIVWGTDAYEQYGAYYKKDRQIFLDFSISLIQEGVLLPRVQKTKEIQKERTKKKAEVFTPSWLCNKMNNYCDEDWFERKDVFNKEVEDDDTKTWTHTIDKILFANEREWHKYVNSRRIEITCGEAPFLVSRYDTTSGEIIPIEKRNGILDRKLRVVGENTKEEKEWYKWAKQAYKSVYGFEYQGDNLLIARINLLQTFMDYYEYKFEKKTPERWIKTIIDIITWNLWQMDGLNDIAPFGIPQEPLFYGFERENTIDVYCKIKKWKPTGATVIEYRKIKGERGEMKFDYVIGNPPYQENIDNRGEQPPIYHKFYDMATEISDKVELITPARFLFNAGKTPMDWNKKMLQSNHFKVLYYNPTSKDIFGSCIDIKGGISISYIDKTKQFNPINTFQPNSNIRTIINHILQHNIEPISNILYTNTSYKYNKLFFLENEDFINRVSGGSKRYLSSSAFDKFPEVFFDEKPNDKNEYAYIIGRQSNQRCWKYIKLSYLNPPENFNYYKVILPASNGSGLIGETLSTPVVGHTETFISFGKFNIKEDAIACEKYIKSKFARFCLGTKKVTQGNKTAEVWSNVPLQNFTKNSDIDWTKSIPEIDQQLYKKYGLSENEIAFIEKNVKEMT